MAENSFEPDHEQNDAEPRGYDAFKASLRKPVVESETRCQKAKTYFKKFKNRVAFFTLIFVAIYTVVTWLQLVVVRDQERRQLRAYVGLRRDNDSIVKIICMDCDGLPSTPLPAFNMRGNRDIMFLKIKNFGTTPAYRPMLCVRVIAIPLKSDVTVEDAHSVFDDCDKKNVTWSTIWPNEERPNRIVMDDETIENLWKSRTGQAEAVLIGFIRYLDVFNDIHHSYLCYRYFKTLSEEGVETCANAADPDD